MHIKNIIIGGGLSGLLAARSLKKTHQEFLILEAKPALGGRIYSSHDINAQHAHDLGPTWIFPHQHHIQTLLSELSIPIFNQYAKGDILYQQNNQNLIRHPGADAPSMYRIEGGLHRLIQCLSENLTPEQIKTSHVAKKLSYENQQWTIEVEHNHLKQTFYCQNLILALPPRMISTHLTPDNWASHKLTLALNNTATWMAAQAKFLAVYDKPFWRTAGLSGQAFSRIGPLAEIHDASANNKPPYALFGFIGIHALAREPINSDELKSACIDQLVQIFGEEALSFKEAYLKDWAMDKFVASSQDINSPPQHPSFNVSNFANELKSKNLLLVGSEFSQVDAGYLEGGVITTNNLSIE